AGQRDADVTAILELEGEDVADQIGGLPGGFEVEGAGQRSLAGNRQARWRDHALKDAEFVMNLADDLIVPHQVADARALLDELHHLRILAPSLRADRTPSTAPRAHQV